LLFVNGKTDGGELGIGCAPGFGDDIGPCSAVRTQNMEALERDFIRRSSSRLGTMLQDVPVASGFHAVFERLKDDGPGQGDALFPWLAQSADLQQMRWFLQQEVAGEAGFDDLLALTQVKMPSQAKLEMARPLG
jgi:hypothetical protein